MNVQQKAIIDAAAKEGVPACERDARLTVYTMVEATRRAMAKYEVGYNKMTQIQQDAVLADLEEEYKELALIIARVLASGNTPAVPFTLKDLKISNGTVAGIVKGTEKHFNDLISKVQDKAEVLLVLYPRDYADAMDGLTGESDQRALELDNSAPAEAGKPEPKDKAPAKGKAAARTGSDKPTSAASIAKKAIELTPKSVIQAKEFILGQQNTSLAGLQNHLKIGIDKAQAHLDRQVEDGVIVLDPKSETGYSIVREVAGEVLPKEPVDTKAPAGESLSFDGEPGAGEQADLSGDQFGTDDKPVELTDELYEQIKAHILKKKKVSAGNIMVTFSLGDETVVQALDRLELNGVITEENDMGIRSIVDAE